MPPKLLMDVRPLRESPDFRRLWWGSALSRVGGVMTDFAVALQVFRFTGSSLAVGAVGLVSAAAMLLFGPVGGVLADRIDRRRTVLFCCAGMSVVSAALTVQAFAGLSRGQLWLLYALVGLKSMLSSVNAPARRTFMPRLLRPGLVPAGAALNVLAMHSAITVGPLLAGLLTGLIGLKGCYLADAVSFAAALYAVGRLPGMRPQPGGEAPPAADGARQRTSTRGFSEGLRFLTASQVLRGALLADLSACVLSMPTALFPQINAERFGGGGFTLGLLSSGLAIGGVLGSALSGHVGRIGRPGRGMLVCGAIWGLALAGFGIPGPLWAAVLLLGVAGAADSNSVVFRTSIIQAAVPDRMRGRVNSVEIMVGAGTPQLGNFRAGAVASISSPAVSAVTGGLAEAVAVGLMWLLLPGLVRYRTGGGAAKAGALSTQLAGATGATGASDAVGTASPGTTSTPGS